MTFRSSSNKEFPAIASNSFFDAMKDGIILYEKEYSFPCQYIDRVRAAAGNPIATSLEFIRLVNNVVNILIRGPKPEQGLSCTNFNSFGKKASFPYHKNGKGVFSETLAYLIEIEVQARKALHFHSAIFGGLSAWLLEGAASYPFLTRKIGHVLDSMFTVGVPKEWHVGHLLKKTISKSYGVKEYNPPSILLACSLPNKNKK